MRRLSPYIAIPVAFVVWGVGGAAMDDIGPLHDIASVTGPWLALYALSALIQRPQPMNVFASTAVGSVGAVIGYYAWKGLFGQGLYAPGLLIWSSAALIASAITATLAPRLARTRALQATAFTIAGGYELGEAAWLVTTSTLAATTWLAAAADIAIAAVFLIYARGRCSQGAPRAHPMPVAVHHLGCLGGGAASFWLLLVSVRVVLS